MALPPCFHLADRVFPRVRAVAARRLVADGWSQSRTARELGVSQAMVSKYLAAQEDGDDPLVQRLAAELVHGTRQDPEPGGTNPWCQALGAQQGQDDGGPLADLLEAERRLTAADPMRVVPQIGVNLARAARDAGGPQQVLSFPGRLVEAGGRLVSPAPPAYGASGHLARCLLRLRDRDTTVHGLGSIRGDASVVAAAEAAGLGEAAAFPRHGRGEDPDALFAAALDGRDPLPRLVHDPGAFGIEPCLYVSGADARAVARAILEINDKVNP